MKVAIIPARGGSKRIPGKNIKVFGGKPMIAWSIEAALKSECFEQVIVSTDDHEIAEIALRYGAAVPFIRPTALADDYTGTTPVIKHAIEWLSAHGQYYSYALCLYATAPFVRPQAIINAHQQLQKTQADFCFTATEFAAPIQRAFKLTAEKRVAMFDPKKFNQRSQDLEPAYHDAGQFYWGKSEAFIQQHLMFSTAASPYLLPRYLVQDIDTLDDWKRAELMFKVLQQNGDLV